MKTIVHSCKANQLMVVHLRTSFLPLTENWIYNQVIGQEKICFKFYTIVRENKDSFPLNNLRCLWEDLNYLSLLFNRVCNKFFHFYPHILIWFLKDRPNLVHAHFGPTGYDFLKYTRLVNIPLITSFYGFDAYRLPQRDPLWKENYKKLFFYGKLFLAEGPAMRRKLIELGCPVEKVMVHHIGIRIDKYNYFPRKPGNDNVVRLLIVGRFTEKKGIPYAIRAVGKIKKRASRNIHLTIVGDSDKLGTLTEEKKKILDAISQCELSNNVSITGYISHNELMEIIYQHHILLSPSVYAADGNAEGGFPVIITEAMATGMPVLATAHCDIPEIVKDGKNGFLVPERNVDALAEKLEYLIEHPEIWPEMGKCGRKIVEEHFDIKKLNQRLVKVYEILVTGNTNMLRNLKSISK